jgi:2-hydroxy-6-oxonona-2,4-dienedioate hydrolase
MANGTALASLTDESTARIVDTGKWKLNINEAGKGHPIIMLHGTGPGATGWSNFNQNLRPLAAKYRVILVDAPGWGKSDPLPAAGGGWVSSEAHVESLKALMDSLGLEKAAIVGNSMGGGTALRFCATYPDRVSHAVTMGAGLFSVNIFSPAGPPEGMRIIVETYKNPTPENFRRLVNVMVYDPSFVTDELLQQRSTAALANKTHLDNWLATLAGGPGKGWGVAYGELVDKLSRFKAPSMFIHGRDDRVVPMEGTLRAVSVVPNSRAVILNRCGHWAQVEHAHEFNQLLDTFLSGSATGGEDAKGKSFGS